MTPPMHKENRYTLQAYFEIPNLIYIQISYLVRKSEQFTNAQNKVDSLLRETLKRRRLLPRLDIDPILRPLIVYNENNIYSFHRGIIVQGTRTERLLKLTYKSETNLSGLNTSLNEMLNFFVKPAIVALSHFGYSKNTRR